MHISKTTVACAVISGLMVAGVAKAEDEATGSLNVDVTSAYIFRGNTVNDEINVNPTAEVMARGITFGVWGNFNTDISEFDEVDLYASYDLPLEDSPIGIGVGYTEYVYPGQSSTAADGTVSAKNEADREVSATLSPTADVMFSPSLLVAYGFQGALDEGIYLELGGSHDVPVSDDLVLEAGAALGYEAGDNVAENGFSHLTLSLGTDVGPASVGVSYVVETDDKVLTVDEDFFVTVGMGL